MATITTACINDLFKAPLKNSKEVQSDPTKS